MKARHSLAAAVAALVSTALAQGPPNNHGGWGGSGAGSWSGGFGPSCLSDCWSAFQYDSATSSLCKNSTAVDKVNSCVDGSSCSDGDKQATYQTLAQLCADAGASLTARPEASFSATSGGSAYPTSNSGWASYASSLATLTAAPSNWPFNGTGDNGGWSPGADGHGPFGSASGGGWGPWSSGGSWTKGPWTSWWGTSGCPASTWSGWTSGPWGTSAPWTTWTGCTASTTASSVVTSTVTTAGYASVVTTTAFGVQVAQASNTGSAARASSSGSAANRDAVVAAGVGLGGLVAALFIV